MPAAAPSRKSRLRMRIMRKSIGCSSNTLAWPICGARNCYRASFAARKLRSSDLEFLRGRRIVFQPHSEEPRAIGEAWVVEQVVGARIDYELHVRPIARLAACQPRAIRRGRHVIQCADENQSRDRQRGIGLVCARGIKRRRGFERQILRKRESGGGGRRGDLKSGIGALRIADSGDPCRIDVRQISQDRREPRRHRTSPAGSPPRRFA